MSTGVEQQQQHELDFASMSQTKINYQNLPVLSKAAAGNESLVSYNMKLIFFNRSEGNSGRMYHNEFALHNDYKTYEKKINKL